MFGTHLMLDLEQCNATAISSLDEVYRAIDSICPLIGMIPLIRPYVFPYDGGGDATMRGVTGMVIIAESHISVHTFPVRRYVFVDVFSCKGFDLERAREHFARRFDALKYKHHVVNRGENFATAVGTTIEPASLL